MNARNKPWLIAAAILIMGAAIGWGASMMAHQGPAARPDTLAALPGDMPASGSLAPGAAPGPSRGSGSRTFVGTPVHHASALLASGTSFPVTVREAISSGTASQGASWSGEVADDIYSNGRLIVPAGATVSGTVARAIPAQRGNRAELQLAVSSIYTNGRSYGVHATSSPIVAGSPRVRNVGAIAGGTAAGAILGHAIGRSSRGTLIGAIVGGGAATAAVAGSHGYQATVPAGRAVEFTVR